MSKMHKMSAVWGFIILFAFVAPVSAAPPNDTIAAVAPSADKVSPLPVGAKVPSAEIRAASGQSRSIQDVIADKPTILVFYRGGWCPYCNSHLGSLAKIEGELVKLGFQIVAISPDKPAKILENAEKLKEAGVKVNPHYQIYSDSKMELSKSFGLAFKVDDETVKMYKEKYAIDIEADSGETHHLLPVPAAYVINKTGAITFRYFNADYKQRVEVDSLLEAARAAIK